MGRLRAALSGAVRLSFGLVLLMAAVGPIPARAQIMHDDGVALPWFHSRAEQMARRACEDNLPECRDSVRRQLATEKMITTLAPWVLLCLVILGAFIYVRRREAGREERRHQAARQHIRETQRGHHAPREVGTGEPQPEPDDDMGFGRPGDRHG